MSIENTIYFALGFFIAILIALVIMSRIWQRAVRLTKKRLESASPITREEILANKDQMRAEFALSTQRLELITDNLRKKISDQLATLSSYKTENAILKTKNIQLINTENNLNEEQKISKEKIFNLKKQITEISQNLRLREQEINEHKYKSKDDAKKFKEQILNLSEQVKQNEIELKETQEESQKLILTLKDQSKNLSAKIFATEGELKKSETISKKLIIELEKQSKNISSLLKIRENELGENQEKSKELIGELEKQSVNLSKQLLKKEKEIEKDEKNSKEQNLDLERQFIDISKQLLKEEKELAQNQERSKRRIIDLEQQTDNISKQLLKNDGETDKNKNAIEFSKKSLELKKLIDFRNKQQIEAQNQISSLEKQSKNLSAKLKKQEKELNVSKEKSKKQVFEIKQQIKNASSQLKKCKTDYNKSQTRSNKQTTELEKQAASLLEQLSQFKKQAEKNQKISKENIISLKNTDLKEKPLAALNNPDKTEISEAVAQISNASDSLKILAKKALNANTPKKEMKKISQDSYLSNSSNSKNLEQKNLRQLHKKISNLETTLLKQRNSYLQRNKTSKLRNFTKNIANENNISRDVMRQNLSEIASIVMEVSSSSSQEKNIPNEGKLLKKIQKFIGKNLNGATARAKQINKNNVE